MAGLYRDRASSCALQLGEADRIVVFMTEGQGKVRAVAKGVRKTKSRFGARLEPPATSACCSTRAGARHRHPGRVDRPPPARSATT